MSVLLVPKKFIMQIQRFTSNFLWNQGENTRHHWVAWEKVTKPIEEGGLGLKLLSDISYFWRSKLAWSFIQNKTIWAKFMNQKYKVGAISGSDSKLWKGLEPICADLMSNSYWKIGEGAVSFWGQKWWHMDNISVIENDLPDDLIKNIWSDDNRKYLYIESLPEELKIFAAGIQLKNTPDQLIWKPAEDGFFSSRNYRLNKTPRQTTTVSWWKNFWQKWIPSKCSCFIWKCLNYAVPVDEVVQKMHIALASRCICCKTGQMETLDHLFLFSEAAKEVWNFLHSIFGMNFSYHNFNQATYIWVRGSSKSQFGCLKILAFVLAVWEIWKWRNRCIFENLESSSSIKFRVIKQLQQYNFLIKPTRAASWTEKIAIASLHIPVINPQMKKGHWAKWFPHSDGLTMNFHSRIYNSIGQGGFLVRDNRGSIIHRGRWDLDYEENKFKYNLQSLEIALKEISDKGLKLAEIQGDSGKLIHCIQGTQACPWSCIDRLELVKKQCRGILLKQIVKEQNQAAVDMVSEGSDSRRFTQSVREDKDGLARWSWCIL